MKRLFLLTAAAVISVQCGIRHKVNIISGSEMTVDISLRNIPRTLLTMDRMKQWGMSRKAGR